jgi:predicted AAA+ superfamily ATPase
MWISRDVEGRLKRSAKTRPVIVLTGARQTGKTSTFRHLFPDYAFVSLDLPTEAEQAEKEPERFLQRNPPPVIIDEVQYAPGIFRHLKVAVDAHRTRNGQFLLTGSQKFTLMKNVSESLAGRADIVELETLSFAEIRDALPNTDSKPPSCAAGSRSSTPTRKSIRSPSTIPISQHTWNATCAP